MHYSGKKGYIFTLDLFIAVIIVVAGSFIILFNIFNSGQIIQPKVFSDDLLREAYTKQIFQLNYPILTTKLNSSAPYGINDPAKSVAEQSAEFYYLAKTTGDAGWNESNKYLLNSTISPVIPAQYSYNISISDGSRNQVIVSKENIPFSESTVAVPSKIIVSGIGRNGKFYGPYLFEVLLWQ